MKHVLQILTILILATGCARKVTNTTTRTTEKTTETTAIDSAKVREAVEVSTTVKDSARAEIKAEEARATILEGREKITEARSGGVRTILKIDSTGRIFCEAMVDSLIRVIDSLEYWQKHKTTTVITEKDTETLKETTKETWANRWAKKIILPLALFCFVLGYFLSKRV